MSHSSLRLLAQTPLVLAAFVASSLSLQAACSSTSSHSALAPPAAIPATSKTHTATADNANLAPPGLVLIPGGRTVIGTEVDDIKKMLIDNFAQRPFASAYIAETPQFKKEVPEFALMVTEVTNEQFAAYIEATGNRPPEAWGTKAIQAATSVFLNEQGALRQKAKEEGLPIPPREKFDGQEWWNANWKDAEWEVPKGTQHKPVVYVDYGAAEDYARWAGLRLMTEFEYQRAVRGKTSNNYPWGEEWKPKHAVTSELEGNAETRVVGSLKEGASAEGVYDLIGNAWEWTSSPFVPFPKYKSQKFKLEKGRDGEVITPTANWDANKRVCVGGGYHADKFISRCTTRRGASRTQTADAQTFRCAASRVPGVDIAERIMTDELDAGSRPKNQDGAVQYAPADTLAVDRWTSKALADSERPVAGYEVINGYDYVTFTPVEKVYSVDVNDLNRRILEDMPEPIGFLSTNQRILSPDLEPGTYMISYRCEGKRRADNSLDGKGKAKEEAAVAEVEDADPWDLGNYEERLGLDESKAYFLFFNNRVELVGFVEAQGFDKKSGKVTSPGSARFYNKKYTRQEEDENGKKVDVEIHEQWLRFDANLRARAARRGFAATLAVQVEDDLDASSFRVSTEK